MVLIFKEGRVPKEEGFRVIGKIVQVLPNALFDVELENGHKIKGHISGRMRNANINILLGDKVTLEMSPYDMSKGRIVWREK